MAEQKQTVLLVDDEENVLKSLNRVLRSEGYQILTATSADKGIEVLAANEIGVVVSDCKMPGMSGEEFLEIIREKYPKTYRVMYSGATYTEPEKLVSSGLVEKFIDKPISTPQEMIKPIREGMDIYVSRRDAKGNK